jgi:hypothetical protein
MSSRTSLKVKPLSKEEEAELIIDKLTRTNAEREAEFLKNLEESIAKIAAQAIADEIDSEIIRKIQQENLNNFNKTFPGEEL